MAQPPPASGQPWQSPVAQPNRGPALEPIDLPPAIEQGVDMIYIDESLVPRAVHQRGFLAGISDAAWSAAPVDLFTSVNPIYTELRRGLVKYEQSWGSLPQIEIPAGPTLKPGTTSDRVALLRTRLGLSGGDTYDAPLAAKVKEFQGVHGLKNDGIAGAGTIDALNRGAMTSVWSVSVYPETSSPARITRLVPPCGRHLKTSFWVFAVSTQLS